jgi:hypothetical protein
MQLHGEELIRRFLLHILPKGFMRIRHFGLLANRCRKDKRVQILDSLAQAEQKICRAQTTTASVAQPLPAQPRICPKCHRGLRGSSETFYRGVN